VLLADEDGPACWFAVEDGIRPEAAATVRRLAGLGLDVAMVSGDDAGVVAALAHRLGIGTAVGGATPDAKLVHVQALQRRGARVVMVGDGVNDAPVLETADVSIAMGSGTALARSHADAVALKDSLAIVADAVALARAARRVMRQNLGWAIAYNVVALPLAALGWITPYWAALGMSASSLVVVLNAVRLGRGPGEAPSTRGARVETTVSPVAGAAEVLA
jgi:Cu2+-exporting ATPase